MKARKTVQTCTGKASRGMHVAFLTDCMNVLERSLHLERRRIRRSRRYEIWTKHDQKER
jgi:hypothetical protein